MKDEDVFEKYKDLPKTRKEAVEANKKYYFTGVACKHGHVDKRQTTNSKCRSCATSPEAKKKEQNRHKRRYAAESEKLKEYQREYRKKNPDTLKERKRKYYEDNSEYVKQRVKQYRKENIGIVRERDKKKYEKNKTAYIFRASKRRAMLLQRSLNLSGDLAKENDQKIKDVYERCDKITLETGVPHHVDHIIPLQGETVSGLHVWYNLQLLTSEENHAKYNHLLEEYIYEIFDEEDGQ